MTIHEFRKREHREALRQEKVLTEACVRLAKLRAVGFKVSVNGDGTLTVRP